VRNLDCPAAGSIIHAGAMMPHPSRAPNRTARRIRRVNRISIRSPSPLGPAGIVNIPGMRLISNADTKMHSGNRRSLAFADGLVLFIFFEEVIFENPARMMARPKKMTITERQKTIGSYLIPVSCCYENVPTSIENKQVAARHDADPIFMLGGAPTAHAYRNVALLSPIGLGHIPIILSGLAKSYK
jgi:hypothetical protein